MADTRCEVGVAVRRTPILSTTTDYENKAGADGLLLCSWRSRFHTHLAPGQFFAMLKASVAAATVLYSPQRSIL